MVPPSDQYHNLVRTVLLSLLVSSFLFCNVNAVNFEQCLQNLKLIDNNSSLTSGGTDNYGNPVSMEYATGLTYDVCVHACGGGSENFDWSVFSQQFSAWLLPWLALVSQLPYGSRSNWDNLMSMLLTVGSPALAAYSLIMTLMNGQWVSRRFGNHNYPNNENAIRILRSLQQSPLKISRDPILLASLVVLPQNDEWWKEFYTALNYTHTWNISASTSIFWVAIAYVFTLVDSFTSISSNINSNGQGVGSSWLWLLPIVIGWLQISPKCDMERLNAAFKRVNRIAYRATPAGVAVRADDVSSHRAFSLHNYRNDSAFSDEECSPPIFNYARVFSWAQSVEQVAAAFRQASCNAGDHIAVDTKMAWVHGKTSGEVVDANRIGTADQVINYCKMPIVQQSSSRWGPDVLSRMLVASIFALSLQWGTTGAAVVVVWYTPTTGLGCRSAGYLLFGALSTISWILLVASSVLAHYSTLVKSLLPGRPPSTSQRVAAVFATILRRIGKTIASINAVWIVLSCMLQFSSIYDNCFCNSSVFGRGFQHAYNVIELDNPHLAAIKTAWACAAGLSGTVIVIFVGFVRIFIDLEPSP